MRARQRHINARDAGATLVLDARYIHNLAEDALVSSWTDRSRSGNNASQATSGLQPQFKKGNINGLPSVGATSAPRFEYMTLASPMTSISSITVMSAYTCGTSGRNTLIGQLANWTWQFNVGDQIESANREIASIAIGGSGALPNIATAVQNGSTGIVFEKGSQVGTGTWAGTPEPMTETSLLRSHDYAAKIGCLYWFPSVLNTSLQKRFERHIGLAFKIGCN